MTRDEALRRLEGTWSFDVVGERVLLRELRLLDTVAAVRRERGDVAEGEAGVAVASPLGSVASSGD